ncbi:MAG TPA: RDD family protein, partial [Clostridia bacterium]|nr:RDD family protein [Clostridia bacterium]
MMWYYVENGQQAGPVEDSQLQELVRLGRVQSDTLVWREGMTNWQPCREAMPASFGAVPVAAGAVSVGAPAAGNEAVCAECGGIFNAQDMITHGNMHICARCKPVFMQKLAEGATLNTGELNYAGFWTRFAAVLLDGVLLWVVNFMLSLAAGTGVAVAAGAAQPARFSAMQLILLFVQIAIGLSYETFMIGKYGATLGKMACKIKVVTADGGRVSYLRAFGRYFAKSLSAFTCMIGYIMAAFDSQ